MLEMTIGKREYMLKTRNNAFNVDIMNYATNNGITDMNESQRVCSGVYLTTLEERIDYGISVTLELLNKHDNLEKPIILFDRVNIARELTETEKNSREALARFLDTEISEPNTQLGTTFQQVLNFRNTVNLIKDKAIVNSLLPVEVNSVAFLVMDNTEADFVLSKEAELIGSWVAPNGITFNTYKLW